MSRVKGFNYRLWFFNCESSLADFLQGLLRPLMTFFLALFKELAVITFKGEGRELSSAVGNCV